MDKFRDYLLASICNDIPNHNKYKVRKSGKCYYEGKYIGLLREEVEGNIFHTYFLPEKPVESIVFKGTVKL